MLHVLLSAALSAAQLFAPGVISGPANDGAPSFTPDGKTLFFTRSGATAGTILESHLRNGTWSMPTIAPFSGHWNDQHAAISPDGSFLVFTSTRPAPEVTGHVAHLWRVARTATGWGTPTHLPVEVNIGKQQFKPSVGRDGSIYFLSIEPGHKFQLYVSHFVSGNYQTAEKLPFSTPDTADVDPEIARDDSFMIFASSGRHGKDDANEHLYIVKRTSDGSWGDVAPLHYAGDDTKGNGNDNEPDLAPDGHTLYFSSDRTVPETFPRTTSQAIIDLKNIQTWNNGATNVWILDLGAAMRGSP
jgi:Tol biopolymer transport system component